MGKQKNIEFEGMESEDLILANKEKAAKEELKRYLAYKIEPGKRQECKELLEYHFTQAADQNRLLDEMLTKGELLEVKKGYGQLYYYLPTDKYLDILWDLTEREVKIFDDHILVYDKRDYFVYWYKAKEPLRKVMMKWKFKRGEFTYDWEDAMYNDLAFVTMMNCVQHEHWREMLEDIDMLSYKNISNDCMFNALNDISVDSIKRYKEIFVDSKRWNKIEKYEIGTSYLFFSEILTGKIGKMVDLVSTTNPTHMYMQALKLQYAKDYGKSVAMYRKAIKAEKAKEVPKLPFFSVMYIMALKKDKKISSINRLPKIYNDLHTNFREGNGENISSLILLSEYFEYDATEYTSFLDKLEWTCMMDFVLSVMILRHYDLFDVDQKQIERVEEVICQGEFKLLQFEASALPMFTGRHKGLAEELMLEPVFEPYRKLEAWEKNIQSIKDYIEANASKTTKGEKMVKGEASSRIVYLVDSGGNFHPRLQKSKDGVTWTKGRNVALSAFFAGTTEGMSDVDRMVATKVTCYDTWSGGRIYELSNDKVFLILANHPHVYAFNNPEVSVQIVKEEPYIQVESRKDGFNVYTNVPESYNNSNTIVNKYSEVLYRVFDLSTIQRNVIELFKKQASYPLAAREELTNIIMNIAPIITVHSDLESAGGDLKTVDGSARITVQILPMGEGVKVELFVKPIENSLPYCKANEGKENCIAMVGEDKVMVKRNMKKEQRNYGIISKLLLDVCGGGCMGDTAVFEDMYGCLELIERLQSCSKIARIEWPKGAKLKIRGSVSYGDLKLNVRERGAWFEVDGTVEVDKKLQLSLAELLAKSRGNNGRFVELTSGEYLALSEKLRKELSRLDANVADNKKGIMLSTFSTMVIKGLEENGATVKKDKAFKALHERIKGSETLSIQVPHGLQVELRDYQMDGYKWLSRLAAWGAGACLADDMGLGKTVQTIALLLSRASEGASLIVAPASVVHNWRKELARFAPTLNCVMLNDSGVKRDEIINSAKEYDVVVSTYGLLNNISELLKEKKWNIAVLDEAHNIKNRDTKSSKAAMQMNSDFRLMLTGTPIQNHLGEIWNLFQFTNPGLLGSFEQFTDKFIIPIEKDNNRVRQQELKGMLQPFLLRRTKTEVLDELPEKTEIVQHVELSDMERAFYENIRELAIANMEEGSLNSIQTLAEITKLRQAACHPALLDDSIPFTSSKINRMVEIAEELITNRHRALVFSQFTSFLKLVEKELKARDISYLYLDGSTPIKEREKLVEEFQYGDAPIFLISLKAGGTGLNLTAADYVIHMDPWWNPAIEDQASDRSHRIGQTRPVTIYKLISEKTIEEKIVELHRSKKSLADSLLEGSNMSHKLSREDILALISK